MLVAALLATAVPTQAQTGNDGAELPRAMDGTKPSQGSPPGDTKPAADKPAATPTPAAQKLDAVEITGARPDDIQERRASTAAKIIVGRDEIERYGDSTLGDVLKRLPGVTIQGRPGRGGEIRMRGLGNGYTQILLDGERVPPGFSLDSLSPDQIERIEILRAPTAETGARAIAGTINIVTRGGYTKRVNDVKIGTGFENGAFQPGVSWTRNIASGPFIVNYSLSAFHYDRDSSSTTRTVDRRLSDDALTLDQLAPNAYRARGGGIHATGRLQWRGDGRIDEVTLTPIVVWNRFRFHADGTLTQTAGDLPAPYDSVHTDGRGGSVLTRLNGEWTHRLAGSSRIETRAGIGQSRGPSSSLRTEQGGAEPTVTDTHGDSRDTSATSSIKLVENAYESHGIVTGAEVEAGRLDNTSTTLQDGVPILAAFGTRQRAASTRIAAYAQDDWSVTPHWATQAGLRWEGIATRADGLLGQPDVDNHSSVWSPLLHAVWKPDPKGSDQVRLSLTRSYRSPTLANLIARPTVNTRYPVAGPNTPTQADRAGNPDLRPELATGIDLAIERYLPGSGLISANVFRRNITDYMRSVTTLQSVPYANVQRYVLRPENVGRASTEGIELESKFRASDLWPGAPRIDVRANASVFHSSVHDVAGPDNRLDQQPGGAANVGGDYRFVQWPLTVGGNVNITPGYTTRISDVQTASIVRKLIADAYALWVFDPSWQVRLSLSNLDPRAYVYGSSVDGQDITGVPVRETSSTTAPTFINVQVRLEMRL